MDPILENYQAGDKRKFKIMLLNRIQDAVHTFHSCDTHDCETHGNWAKGGGKGRIGIVGEKLSTSVPTAVGSAYKAGDVQRMSLGLVTEGVRPKIIANQSEVPGFEDLKEQKNEAALEEIVNRQSRNIEELFDTAQEIGPDTVKAHADWYPFVNEWAHEQGADLGHPPEAIMAAAAVLSPSADWANNVAWTKATAEFVANEKNITVQPEWIASQYMAATASHAAKIKKHGRENEKLIAQGKEPKPFTIEPPNPEEFTHLVGKKASDLSPQDAAITLRGAHEAFGKAIHQLGGHAGFGNPKNIATPQTIENFAKAISILRNPSTENIDANLGKSHKVRSFYSNMRDPLDTNYQEVTVDSHHLGVVNGLPLASENPLVKRIYDTPKVASTGLVGTYPLIVESTRRATAAINKKYGTSYTPNQVQSITWEAHRGLFPSNKRTSKLVGEISTYRQQFQRGEISRNEMRARIENARLGAGGPTLEQVREKFLDELGKG